MTDNNPEPDVRLDRLSSFLVRFCARVLPGEVVHGFGPPGSEQLLETVGQKVLRAGGLFVADHRLEAGTDLQSAEVGRPGLVPPGKSGNEPDVEIYLHGGPSEPLVDGVSQPGFSRDGNRQARREQFLRRVAAGQLRWLAAQYPCAEAAAAAGMTAGAYADFLYTAMFLDRPDPARAWERQAQRQAALIERLQQGREMRLVTPAGTDLRLGIAGRTWLNGDGRANFPDGEVFTAPIEDAVEGVVVLDYPVRHGGREASGVRLHFRAGRVIAAAAEHGEPFLHAMLDRHPGARVLGEVALGCNYALRTFSANALLDEKVGGTFHVALGQAYPATGGHNASPLHWDLVGDLRTGGWVEVDGERIGSNGLFTNPAWPGP